MNLYQCAKDQAFSSLCSRDLVNLKILKSDWPRGFWLIVISGIRLLQIWDLCKHTANNMNFHYRPKSEKIINDQFFQSIQKNFQYLLAVQASSSLIHPLFPNTVSLSTLGALRPTVHYLYDLLNTMLLYWSPSTSHPTLTYGSSRFL